MSLTAASVEILLTTSAEKSPRGFDLAWFNLTQFWSCLYEMFSIYLQSLPPLPLSSGWAQIQRTFAFVFFSCTFLLSDVPQGGLLSGVLLLCLAVGLNSSLISATERFEFPWFPGACCTLCSSEGVRTTSVKIIVSSY